MPAPESEFHDFVVAFADPLARLAYLLTVGLDVKEPHRLAAAALGQTRRHWREVRATGAPETYAIEALLARLPRPWRHEHSDLATNPDAQTRVMPTPVMPVPALPVDPDARYRRPPPPSRTDGDEKNGDETPDDDVRAIRDALWRAWQELEARQRVPLVFADPQVASPRLASIDLPEGFASRRRVQILAEQAVARLRIAAPVVDLDITLIETLAEHAGDIDQSPDPYAEAQAESRRGRRRIGVASAAVIAALVAGGVVVTSLADSPRRTPAATALATPSPAPSPAPGSSSAPHGQTPAPRQFVPLGGDSAPLPAGSAFAAALNWPIRGNLSQNQPLVDAVAATFASRYGDIVAGSPHVVLVDDTRWFRIACVVAATPVGTMRAWLYGPLGSASMRVASVDLDSGGVHGAIAGFLSDGAGHSVLVAVGPPAKAQVHLGDIYLGAPLSAGASASSDDGVLIRDMSGVPADSVYLQFVGGGVDDWSGRVPGIALAPSSTTADDVALLSGITVDRGEANPQLLRVALAAALKAVPLSAMDGVPVVLWGGDDEVGNHGIVLRVATYTGTASLIVAWAEDPSGAVAFPIASNTSDFPVAFPYVGAHGARIGVLPGVPQVNQVGVVVDGVDRGIVPVRFDGFASVAVGAQHGLLADQTVEVNLIDSTQDRLLGQTTLPQPPHETTAQAMRGIPTR